MKKILIASILLVTVLGSCTKKYEEINTNPYGLADSDLDLGLLFPSILRNINVEQINSRQIGNHLTGDSYAQYLSPSNNFASGSNNTTYKINWNDEYWNISYKNIMPAIKKIQDVAGNEIPLLYGWAELLKVMSLTKLTSIYGPIIYSQYASSSSHIPYDREEDVYKKLFDGLDVAYSLLLTPAIEMRTDIVKYDIVYGGDLQKWIKLINSWRLKLALRVFKGDPILAQAEYTKALTAEFGLIESNSDNMKVPVANSSHPDYDICYSWNDSRASATIVSFMKGLQDPRIETYFEPCTIPGHETEYIGFRTGVSDIVKDFATQYTNINKNVYSTKRHIDVMVASEVAFIRSEASLIGLEIGNVASFYEAGIRLSMENEGIDGAKIVTYLLGTTPPTNYVDPMNGNKYGFTATTNVVVAHGGTPTLEQIMTQKWIAMFPDGIEAWTDIRRTGYPVLPPVASNQSGGQVLDGEYIQRLFFSTNEYSSNSVATNEAVTFLSEGKDEIGVKLWFCGE